MKYLRFLVLFLSATMVFTACQKELSLELGLATGSLKSDTNGDCLPVLINGTYQKDTLLNATNYVDVQVNIVNTGAYVIKTDTINGYSFSASGSVAVAGLNTIRLLGSGRPVAPSLDVFTVKFDTSSCQINVIVTGTGGGSTTAVYTLVGTPTTCTGATQSNNFYATIQTTPANFVDVKVDVTTAGTYTITSSTVNGVSFSSTGNLSVGTNQTIRLLASGTPTAAGPFQYALNTTTPASNCGFSLTVQAAPTPATYSFDCSTPQFFGTYQAGSSTAGDSVIISITSTAGGSYSISSNTQNNVTFSGSGVLAASPTPQNVTLYASAGPASAAGTFTYTITGTGGTGTCSLNQTYSSAPSTNGTLSFNIGSVTKTFNFINSADTSVVAAPPPLPPGNFFLLSINGDAAAGSQESFYIDIAKQAPYFINGSTYNVNQFAQFILLDVAYTDNTGIDYTATTDGSIQTMPFSVTINTITATNVTGTFTGAVKNTAGATLQITNGAFNLPLQ
ncbi:hypothetical protein ACFOWM_05880 [Ferruginibacter yonginensis]|uniref:Uncharacterized protein n=1 Tax=Ferruginibacter yonginensis TaxID=1310416 RepID=A0ABV8QTY5_9BACT